MSTAKFDTLSTLNGSYSVPVSRVAQGTAAAWVNFNGTGTVAIRASFNVSSITDNGTGDYTLNFTTAMVDANYAAVAIGEINGGAMSIANNQTVLAASWNVRVRDNSGNNADSSIITAAIFR